MTANLILSIKQKALLETAPKSGRVCTKVDENSRIRPQVTQLGNLVGYDPDIQGAIHQSYRVRIDFVGLSEVPPGRVSKTQ